MQDSDNFLFLTTTFSHLENIGACCFPVLHLQVRIAKWNLHFGQQVYAPAWPYLVQRGRDLPRDRPRCEMRRYKKRNMIKMHSKLLFQSHMMTSTNVITMRISRSRWRSSGWEVRSFFIFSLDFTRSLSISHDGQCKLCQCNLKSRRN